MSRVDLDARRIDFRLVTGNDDVVLRAMRDKTGGGPARDEAPARKGGKGGRGAQRPASGAAAVIPELKAAVRKAAGKKGNSKGRPPAPKSKRGRRG